MAEHESSLAVLVDFENMARPGAKGRGDFDIHLVLNRLAEKGRVLVKRAYADWSRYRDARHELQNAGLGLIEMPSAREGAKNRADIQMAVDAMELAYSREHVDTFVIVSGDSDFTPLVGKLRELNKRVIGVGNRESASELLIANCDEFIFYDLLAAQAGGALAAPPRRQRPAEPGPAPAGDAHRAASARAPSGRSRASSRTRCAASTRPSTRASTASRTFSKFLEEAATARASCASRPTRAAAPTAWSWPDGAAPPLPPAAAGAPAERARGEEGDGPPAPAARWRRSEPAATADAGGRAEATDGEAEVFEVVITPTPDVGPGRPCRRSTSRSPTRT